MGNVFITTKWETYDYDVWGNERDGWDVNDTLRGATVKLRLKVEVNNRGTPQEFLSAYPTDRQIRSALGIKKGVRLSLDGDDLNIEVSAASNDYPLGRLVCVSHESLSPIREVLKPTQIRK